MACLPTPAVVLVLLERQGCTCRFGLLGARVPVALGLQLSIDAVEPLAERIADDVLSGDVIGRRPELAHISHTHSPARRDEPRLATFSLKHTVAHAAVISGHGAELGLIGVLDEVVEDLPRITTGAGTGTGAGGHTVCSRVSVSCSVATSSSLPSSVSYTRRRRLRSSSSAMVEALRE